MIEDPIDSLEYLLRTHQPNCMDKVHSKLEGLQQIEQRLFFYLFAVCTRWFEAKSVDINGSLYWQEKDAFKVLSQWQWPNLARLYLLLLIAKQNTKEDYTHLYRTLFDSADLKESILLIQSLAFIPHPEAFIEKARIAARSNITPLLSAIAHNCDYAFKYFDESGWNQLVLKAAFLGEPIISIYGLKSRNNIALVTMLGDYAKERQAAARTVPWDLWPCIAWLAKTDDDYKNLKAAFSRGDTKTKSAIALALMENNTASAVALAHHCLQDKGLQALSKPLTWETILKFQG